MSYLDNQRVLMSLALQIQRKEPLSEEQLQFLAVVFYRIGAGEDANKVLSVRLQQGQKLSDVVARCRMSLILHWIAGAIQPDPQSNSKHMTVEAACVEAVTTIVPVARKAFPGADSQQYDAEYIQRCWSEPAYAHMRSPDRGWIDSDFPYNTPPAPREDPR